MSKNDQGQAGHFVSGLWRGYYEQHEDRFAQEQTMEFADGMVRGEGSDDIGEFMVEGSYHSTDQRVQIGWVKTYTQGHSLLYIGSFDGAWIHGHWELEGGYVGDSFGFAPAAMVGGEEDWR